MDKIVGILFKQKFNYNNQNYSNNKNTQNDEIEKIMENDDSWQI